MTNENNEVVFPYQVNTIMPITGLSFGNLMVPSTAKLTKEDVAICIKKAPVFRRFQNGKLERVTISSIDRLHNEKFMSEEEYEEFLDKQSDNRGKVYDNTIKEEPKKEIPVVESVIKEADTAEDENTDQTETITVETTVKNINDEGISEDVTESVNDEDKKNEYNQYRYNNKKKHNR